MPTNINFNKKLGITGGTQITLPSSSTPFSNSNSFSFDGVDEYFDGVGTYSELDGQNKATCSFWIKPTSVRYGNIFHIPRNTTNGNSQAYCFIDNSNRIRFSMNSVS